MKESDNGINYCMLKSIEIVTSEKKTFLIVNKLDFINGSEVTNQDINELGCVAS